MTSLRVMSAAAAIALMLPLAAPTESFAQLGSKAGGGGGSPPVIGGGGGVRAGGGGGGFRAGAGGGGFVAGGVGSKIGGGYVGGGPGYSGGGTWQGSGSYRGGHRRHRHGGGFIPGLVIGGAFGSSYGYYGAPYGYGVPYGYYDDGYYDEGLVAVVPGGDEVAYCKRRFRSYDVRSRTYLGFDGLRHPCP